jgi:hypothetical protein
VVYKEWKQLLHAFVQYQNEINLQYTLDPEKISLLDKVYASRQSKRLKQLKKQHQLRNIIPLRNEVRAKIEQLEEKQSIVKVRIKCAYRFDYRMGHKELEEHQHFEQSIVLNKENGFWFVKQAECPMSEKVRSSSAVFTNSKGSMYRSPLSAEQQAMTISMPLIHQHVYTRQPNPLQRRKQYDRQKVQAYADKWWDGGNPDYIHFDVDCTNYVSQCLYAGGAPMNYTGKRETGWWYKGKQNNREWWSFSWSVSHSLKIYLDSSTSGLHAREVQDASQLDIGDVIVYDWDGDGKYQHSTIVAAMDDQGMPLVNAHTTSSYHRYWDYKDSYAWSDQTVYRLFHIADEM